jgi:opacity protein-like surface antigen
VKKVILLALVLLLPATAGAQGLAPTPPDYRSHVVGHGGLTFGTETAPLFGVEVSGDITPVLQAYGTFDWHRNVAPKWVQDVADFSGYDLGISLPSYVGLGGIKVTAPSSGVRPYGLGGFGFGSGKMKVKVDGEDITQLLISEGLVDNSDIKWTKPIFEVGGGIIAPIGHLYVDVGYRFRKPLGVEDVNMSGVYAGIGASF